MAQFDLGAILSRAKRALNRPDPSADGLLLARFVRDRNGSAFAGLVERHGPAVWAACRRGTTNTADAEDVFQATFLVLARRADRVRKSASVGSWLYGTAVRLARKARSRAARSLDPARLTPPTETPGPAAAAAWREVLAVLDEELARLPDRLRAPLLCCYFDGLTQDEAATRLGWKVRTVKARVARGRRLLHARLARRGVDLSAALAAAALLKEGLSAPPAGAVVALTQAAPGYALRGPVTDTISVTAQALTREGLLMTGRKLAPLLLTACALVLVAVGAGYVGGQGPKSPTAAGPGLAAPGTPALAAKTDLTGDPLPTGAVARLGTSRLRSHGWGGGLRLLPDGQRALWVGDGGRVMVWDVITGQALDSFREPDLAAERNSLSPDANRLAVFDRIRSDRGKYELTLRLYDLKGRKTVWSVRPAGAEPQPGYWVEFTPDGKRLITLGEADLRVWDASTGAELFRQKLPNYGYFHFAVSPDGKTVATGSSDLFLWDWESGAVPRKVPLGANLSVFQVQFAPDGKTVYASTHGNACPKAIDVASGRVTGCLDLGGPAAGFSFSPDGRTMAVAYRNTGESQPSGVIVLRDAATGKELQRLSAAPSRLAGVQWSKDGSRIATLAGNRMFLWDAKTGERLGAELAGHDGGVSSIVYANDGRVYTAGHDATVRAWDPGTGKLLRTLVADADWVPGLAVSADGSLVAASALADEVRVWDARTGTELFKLPGHGPTGGVRRVRFSADDQTLLSWGDDWSLRAFDTLTGKLKVERRFRPRQLAGVGEDEARLQRDTLGIDIRALDLGPDGNTFVMADQKDVHVYAVDTGKERLKVEADPERVEKLALSVDGRWLATAGRGAEPGKAPAGPGDGRDDQVTVWDLANATAVVRFRVPTKTWWSVLGLTPDGRRVVTGSFEPVLRFWDAKTGEPVGTLDLPYRPECVAFSPDGKRLAVGFLDTTALVYDLAAALKPARRE